MVSFEEKILRKMKNYFKSDTQRINHAEKVLRFAKGIMAREKGNREVVIAAAILHDIGIKECERKYNSTNGQLQEKEGPPIAKKILENVGMNKAIIAEVCRIIGSHHSKGEIHNMEFYIIWDADWLVNLKDEINLDEIDLNDKKRVKGLIRKIFFTQTGRKIAEDHYL